MSRYAGVKVEGARQLRRSLRQAGQDMTQLKELHRRIGGVVSTRGTTRAPRVTGRLAGNIRVGATQTASIVRVGGARVPYANPIHWGWKARGIKPRPFLTLAAKETEPVWYGMAQNELQKILTQVKGK